MNFTIVGAGALGSILAAHLHEAGNDVTIIARGKRAEFLQNNGIRLQGLKKMQLQCPVTTEPAAIGDTEVLILTPKTYHHEQALEQVRHIKAGSVFSVANGVQKTERIQSIFGTEHSLGCMADLSGELLEDGNVLFTRNIDLQIGALEAQYQDSANTIAELIHSAGINCHAIDNIRGVEWSKFVSWLGFLALSVITRLESYKLFLDPAAANILYNITREMYALAETRGIRLIDQSPAPAVSIATASPEEAISIINNLGEAMKEKAPAHKMSALQDLENGRPLELEETMGDALNKAQETGVEMPTIETCYQLLRAINNNILI